jgi:hypothetical protein
MRKYFSVLEGISAGSPEETVLSLCPECRLDADEARRREEAKFDSDDDFEEDIEDFFEISELELNDDEPYEEDYTEEEPDDYSDDEDD